ncbi:putative MFS sugar transporter [Mycena filopes]|nr:putative MFS sugar transporter [Mycena filopes]
MQQYFGFRGNSLNAALVWAVIMPVYLCFGYNQGVAGGLLDLPAWVALFPQIDTANTEGQQKARNARIQGTVVAAFTLGALFGALSCTFIGDKLGRRRTIMLGAAVTCIGSIIQCSAFSFPQLIMGRLINGIGFGAISATAPNWQTECSRASHRGFVVMLEGLFISAGLAIAAWVNFALSHSTGSLSWRVPLALPCFFAVVVFLSVPLWPESPRWLVKVGRLEEARQVLAALDDVDLGSLRITEELWEIEISLRETGKGSYHEIFRNGPGRFANRAAIAAAAQCFQQMSGINVLGYYQTTIFRTFLRLDPNTARILSATVFTWVGRRKLMMFGAVGMGLCMALIAGCVSHPENDTAMHAAIGFVYLFSLFFPLSVRTPITALSTTSTWFFNFTVVEATPTGFNSLGYKYFIIYAVINWFLILPAVYFFFPETQGMHLESVDRIFLESKTVFDPVRVAKSLRARAVINKERSVKIPSM